MVLKQCLQLLHGSDSGADEARRAVSVMANFASPTRHISTNRCFDGLPMLPATGDAVS
ncbi:hypothetical protein [Streptomyces sp. NPDC001820]|uniref:hypothetical protein n=1 Tax=Streptomyces sp. NPDC001820 TaxID=3364613 RepID=UPI0036858726